MREKVDKSELKPGKDKHPVSPISYPKTLFRLFFTFLELQTLGEVSEASLNPLQVSPTHTLALCLRDGNSYSIREDEKMFREMKGEEVEEESG